MFKEPGMTRYRYDFYGIIMCDNCFMMPFVIEYDGEGHFNKMFNTTREATNLRDIYKEFFLFKKGISLLRISCFDNLDKEKVKQKLKDFLIHLYKKQEFAWWVLDEALYKERNKNMEQFL